MGQDREGLGLAVSIGEPVQISFAGLIVFQEEDCGFREGPYEMSISDLFPARAGFFPAGLFGVFDQAAIRDEVLDGGEAMDVFDFIEADQAQDSSDARDGLQQGVCPGVVVFGGLDDIAFELCDQRVIGRDHLQSLPWTRSRVRSDALLNTGLIEPFYDAVAILWPGNTAEEVGEVVLASCVLDMSVELGSFSHEVIATSE